MKRALFLVFLAIDVLSKIAALHWIPPWQSGVDYPYGGVPLFSLFGVSASLNTVTNSGAAMGLFGGHATLLFVIRTAIIIGLVVYLLFVHQGTKRKLPLWLITTGAIGNVIDYCAYGHVIDFLHLRFWGHSFPIFNLADCFITFGVCALLWAPKTTRSSSSVVAP